MPKIASFMNSDHRRLDSIFEKYQESCVKSPLEAKRYFSNFRSGLERHIIWEEEVLFPVFEQRTGHDRFGPTAVMREEHRQIKVLLGTIQDNLEKNNFELKEYDTELKSILNAHNDKEEQILYPWIDNVVSEEELGNLFTRMGFNPSEINLNNGS